MLNVWQIRGKKSFAGPGMWGYDAEAKVVDENDEEIFVHVNAYDMFHTYTVSKTSVYDFMTSDAEPPEEVKNLEEYGNLKEAKASKYYKVFEALNKVITRMQKPI